MKRASIALALFAAVLAAGCWGGGDNARWDEAQKETKNQPAVAKEAVSGGSLNEFLAKAPEGMELTFEQEKDGFAMASLKKGGKQVATLSISDLKGNTAELERAQKGDMEILGYPAMASGSKGTALLAADRFLCSVRSSDDSFTEEDRIELLKKFSLGGLEGLGQ